MLPLGFFPTVFVLLYQSLSLMDIGAIGHWLIGRSTVQHVACQR